MKKLLLITAMFMATSVWAGTYTIWGQGKYSSEWIQAGTYSDFGSCEQARRTVGNSFHVSKCVAD